MIDRFGKKRELSRSIEGFDDMQRVDGAYLFDFGAHMRTLAEMEERDCTRVDIYGPMTNAYDALAGVVFHSIFKEGWRVIHTSANALLAEIDAHKCDINDFESFRIPVYAYQISSIKTKYRELEAVMRAELQALALYYVSPKGGFDAKYLAESGQQLFPGSLIGKCPEAGDDIVMGARCLAFELWTAMAFHFHRANEAVLRRYYESVIGNAKKPKYLTMGTMTSSMEQHDVGDINIRAALNNIRVFHRNPISHPDQHIGSSDEALGLYAAIRACMGYMLDKLPVVSVGPVLDFTPAPDVPLLEERE